MPLARKYQILPGEPGFYHCISRCVRRSFLCGFDRYSGCSFEHRRQWIVDRMTFLTECFAIDIYAYTVMHNHYHLVLWVDPERIETFDDLEVIRRWRRLFRGAPISPSTEQLNEWRRRLSDVSWFMRCLNETIARRANQEDNCKGHFWEKRFKSIALLDEPAVLACMAYVDLNPIRAGIAEAPIDSDYTSIQKRIKSLKLKPKRTKQEAIEPLKPEAKGLKPMLGLMKSRLSITESQYAELINFTVNPNEAMTNITSLFDDLSINQEGWIYAVNQFRKTFGVFAGGLIAIEEFIARTGRKRRPSKKQLGLYQPKKHPPDS